jgi:hypothetical protein
MAARPDVAVLFADIQLPSDLVGIERVRGSIRPVLSI